MANETTHVNTLRIGEKGEVRIADDVVTVIAGLAAVDVKGVSSIASSTTRDVIGKSGYKSLSKGVRLVVEEQQVHVWIKVNISYGYNVPETCAAVQDRVATAVETMTGLSVSEVNVRVNSVVMDGAEKASAQ